MASALTRLGQIEKDYEEAATIYRAEGDALRLAHTVRHVGDVLREQRRLDLAESRYLEALQIYSATGNTEPARLLWAEARDLYAAVDVEAGVTECNRRLTACSLRQK